MQMIFKLLSLVLIIGSAAAGADDAAASDYEAKIQAALENYASQSEDILQRSFQKANDGTIQNVEIDADGNVLSSSTSSSIYADFGLKAVDDHLSKIEKLNKQKVDAYDTYQEAFSQLASQNNNNDNEDNPPTITYTQLEEWKDITDIIAELKDGEFLTLWRKAIGLDTPEDGLLTKLSQYMWGKGAGLDTPDDGQTMKLSQFVIFNNLLDKLLMAKVDFMKLTKKKKERGISYDQLWNMDSLSDNIEEEVFSEYWQKSTGSASRDGFMTYEQFLVFYELADEWLDHYEHIISEEDGEEVDGDDESSDDFGEEEDLDGSEYHGLPLEMYNYFIPDEDLPEDLKADLESDDEDIREEAMLRRRLDPKSWAEFSYWELHAYFACDKAMDSPRPLWTDEQWREFRDFYHEFVEEDKKDKDSPDGVHTYQLSEDEYDLTKNAIPFQSGEKGRGLKAVRYIKAGELVFKATNNTIVFNYGHTWRKLLFAINKRFANPGITCDILVWSWVQDLVDGGPLKVIMDMDSGSLLNEGRDEEGWERPNVQCGKPDATRCDMDYFAFRDIKKGDELLIDYNEFAFLDSWPEMGL